MSFIIEMIQSLLILISAFLILISAVGLLSLRKDMKNVVYARIHIIGVFDIACVIGLIGLNQLLLAGIYFIIVPFTAHAMANAFFKSEDNLNNISTNEKVENNPLIYSKSEVQRLERKELFTDEKMSETINVLTLEISEDE